MSTVIITTVLTYNLFWMKNPLCFYVVWFVNVITHSGFDGSCHSLQLFLILFLFWGCLYIVFYYLAIIFILMISLVRLLTCRALILPCIVMSTYFGRCSRMSAVVDDTCMSVFLGLWLVTNCALHLAWYSSEILTGSFWGTCFSGTRPNSFQPGDDSSTVCSLALRENKPL